MLDVRQLPEAGLLVFSDFTHLAAYRNNKLAWQSARVCWDDLKIAKITNEVIEGVGYDPTNSITHERPFSVDLRTGRSLHPQPSSVDGTAIW